MQSICQQKDCIGCCRNTNMHLTQEDIDRIMQAGYPETFFSIEKNGWIQLKNCKKRCVFHDGKKCKIYTIRPAGCRFYPFVYDISTDSAIRDTGCPYSSYFPQSKRAIIQLKKLISELFNEREKRLITQFSNNSKKEM